MALTQKRAEQRSSSIVAQSIKYNFHLILTPANYIGLSEVTFDLKTIPSELHIDLKTKSLLSLNVNNIEVKVSEEFDIHLPLPVQHLKIGTNTLALSYRNKYDNDGNGCVSFTDVDTKQYIYSQFQPYNANRVFAVFDQPDLKATMTLGIIVPQSFETLISNENPINSGKFNKEVYLQNAPTSHKNLLEQFLSNAQDNNIMAIFPQTKMLPTYLYCFVAGPYKCLILPEEKRYKNVPMSLYCIQSLYSYMEGMADFVFEITIESMRFFEKFFGVDFAFNKYDQVFAHEYKCGAMENAGIVTFNDLYIWKEKVSTQTMLDLANTISHELSHHWFGNLSTMKWWDDLWLNESFAEFISHFCLEKIKDNLKTIQYESSMSAFLARKAWGYHEDQLITTHPIAGEVANTSIADSIFDGITYSKGAATMKQLLLLMGEENFSKGLTAFFKKYAFKNATLSDFINELQTYYSNPELTLQEWKSYWLETASLNILEPRWDPSSTSPESQLEIIQTPFTSEHPTLRPHKIKIAFFTQNSEMTIVQTFIKPQERTIVPYNGSKNYKAVLLNYQDHTFAKVLLDTQSLNFFSSGNLPRIPDTLTRTLIWRSFFDMVKDSKLSSLRYMDILLQNISLQKSDSIFQRHFEYLHTAINIYTPSPYRHELNARIFGFILQILQSGEQIGDNRKVILKSQLCDYGHGLLATRILLAWRQDNYTPLKDYQMTIVQKWKAVVHAFEQKQISHQEKLALLENQLSLDKSDAAKLNEATCRSLISTEQQFQKLYQSFKDPQNEQSIALKREIIRGWNHHYHSSRLSTYKNKYFQDVVALSKVLDGDHFEIFLEELLPIDDNLQETIEKLKQVQFGPQEKYDKIRRDVLKIIGDLERRLNAYKKFEAFDSI